LEYETVKGAKKLFEMSIDFTTPIRDRKRPRKSSSDCSSERPLPVRSLERLSGAYRLAMSSNSQGPVSTNTASEKGNMPESSPKCTEATQPQMSELKTLLLELKDSQYSLRQSLEQRIGNLETLLENKLTA
jgi:hypothetical protein